MPIVGFLSQSGEQHSFEEALELCSQGSDEYPYPYPLLKGIIDSQQQRGDYISATSLLHCLRADYLKRRNDYYISVEQAYPMFRGTLFHSLLEKNPNPYSKVEVKAKRKYKGVELGGTYDSLVIYETVVDGRKQYVLQDWKTTKALPKYGAYKSHIEQVNLYRWLNKLPPDQTRMEVHYFTMEGHKLCVIRDGSGRQRQSDTWSDAKVESFLDDRLMKLAASMKADIPVPLAMITEDEKWECAYCPVRQICADLGEEERYESWKKRFANEQSE